MGYANSSTACRKTKEKEETMLHPERIPLIPAEHDAVNDLIAVHAGLPVSLTRRDPGESGPLLVQAGDLTYEVDAEGRATQIGGEAS